MILWVHLGTLDVPVTLTHFKLFERGCVHSVAQDQAELLLYMVGGAHMGQEGTLWVSGVPREGTDGHIMLQAPGKTPLLALLTGTP